MQHCRMSAILDDEHYGDGYSGRLKDNDLCYLGVIYRDGLGVEVNREKALDYLMQSTHNGYGPTISYYELGNFYFAENKYDGTPSVEASKRLMNAAGVRYYQYQPTGKKLEINV